ncbi:MAG: two-component system, sensor histidine kinase and response regulator [Bacteroidota bacterium]|nr:two-component system, sensor histidine kinase and response regulator [Bacteroidota bacterium]
MSEEELKHPYKLKEDERLLKVYADEIRDLHLYKDKLFAIIARDIRGPFIPLLEFTEKLETRIQDMPIEEVKSLAAMLNRSLKNHYSLLDNLHNWAKIQTGNMDFNPREADINLIIRGVIGNLKSNTEKKDITIDNKLPFQCKVRGDAEMLGIVFKNILSNAVKFSKNGGNIEIIRSEVEGGIKISIKDNGIGISPDDINKLFKLNESISRTGTAGERGTGLGLILCMEIVVRHGGSIDVISTPGDGTVFSVTLPLYESE